METPKLFQHCERVYEALQEKATGDIFEGSKVEVFRSVGISQGYYSEVFDILTELGCIEQTRRGTSGQTSMIALHHPPELEEFRQMYRNSLTKRSPLDSIRQQVDDLRKGMPQVDVDSFIISVDGRLSDLESRVSDLEQGR